MVEVLGRIGGMAAVPQPEDGVTYAHKIKKREARLDFARAASEVRVTSARKPVAGAWFELKAAGQGPRG